MKNFKYRINELLEGLPVRDHGKALKCIPKELNVSSATFNNYRNILIDEPRDIPHEKVMILECIFSVNRGELENFKIQMPDLKTLLMQDDKTCEIETAFDKNF
ncbi:hypothetical protein Pedsa_0898 [Pseudopedobacter saltans DSM 12145]|uniref:Uncharacterized protein n=1 Tax=Pseudopedobacter saltans (strain ATCC 51119 / DSM 12145 / JCM 21818 / CCUG 39354 / LMG 10337 / NBRC 100064 / NCIMB 13643) TaxID=762903 RepID=F0SA93_PSESL|nr:hypothetical protein [Pseudopedobacter saltans]ADY51470.1 hypothetical protein Pedsa_0898 [Pseudopedobacter saltans DSM 12145]